MRYRILGKWTSDIYCELSPRKVQAILFYALPVSSPALKRSWIAMERVQRFAARLIAQMTKVVRTKIYFKNSTGILFLDCVMNAKPY